MARDLDSATAEYQRLKALLDGGRYPAYGHIHWSGDVCQVSFTVKFRRTPEEPQDRVRRRAREFLEWLERRQLWRWAEVDISTSADVPEMATVKVRGEALQLFRFGTTILNEVRTLTTPQNGGS